VFLINYPIHRHLYTRPKFASLPIVALEEEA